MDYDELVQFALDLQKRVNELENQASSGLAQSVSKGIFPTFKQNDQFITTQTITHDGGGTEDIPKNNQFDLMAEVEINGVKYAVGLYRI